MIPDLPVQAEDFTATGTVSWGAGFPHLLIVTCIIIVGRVQPIGRHHMRPELPQDIAGR